VVSRRYESAAVVTLAAKVDAETAAAVQALAKSMEMTVSELFRDWCTSVVNRRAYTLSAMDESDRYAGWVLLDDYEARRD
jgi:hypothetical protein